MNMNDHSKFTHAQNKTILIVDDMEANRAVLCRRLERFDCEVISADSGAAALEMLGSTTPDIVLLDFMMPQMNGIEVLREMRANSATRDIPVIMVTARAESEATIEALEAGADDYVTKPIDFEVLLARIETHLSKRSSASNLRRANAALDERVTRRSMALADLETELEEEIRRRRQLEQQLADRNACSAEDGAIDQELRDLVQSISARFDLLFQIITSGKTPNLAQMAELQTKLAALSRRIRPVGIEHSEGSGAER